MWLQRSMLNLACLICFFNNGISLSKTFLYISDSTLVGCRQVSSDICMERELVNYFSLSLIIMSLVVFIKILRSTSSIFNLSVMDKWSTFSHCFLYSKYCIQWLIFYFNKRCGFIGNLFCPCNYSCDSVTYVSNLSVEKSSVMWAWFRITLSSLHIVDIRAVEGSDYGLYSIQFFSFTGID